jgi:uncharacterized protein (DUF885 family)
MDRVRAAGVVGVLALGVGISAACGTGRPQAAASGGAAEAPTAFGQFADEYFDSLYAFAPSTATPQGFHQYDARLEDLSAANIQRRVATLHAQLTRLDSIRSRPMTANDSIDAAVIVGVIRSELQDEETLQNWRKNPMTYVGLPGGAVDVIIERTFAPAPDRLRSVIARERAAPAVLDAMRANVVNPPPEFTDLAIRMASGSVGFFKGTVATWARGAAGSDSSVLREFTRVNDSLATAMQSATGWLTTYLTPRSHGTFAIGATNFADKLRYDELLDIPLDRLLAIGEANLATDRKAFIATAQIIAPGKTPMQAMQSLESDHPTAATLIPAARATLTSTRQFLVDHQIVDLPSTDMPIVAETPPYARNGSTASLAAPGPYETKATEAFYYVTPPEATWDARHVEEHLRQFNIPVLENTTVHEAFPGHYVQALFAKQVPTKTRKLLGPGSNVEGWAHYGEQMMLEEGWGNGDPKARLAQLSDALLRDCRFVVGIKEHTQGLSVAQGASQYFVDQCFQEPANAFEEARRGAYNPTYLYYTLGKLEIYKLRADYQRAKGSTYTLRGFHDEFMRQGGLPLPLMRRVMLPGDAASVL